MRLNWSIVQKYTIPSNVWLFTIIASMAVLVSKSNVQKYTITSNPHLVVKNDGVHGSVRLVEEKYINLAGQFESNSKIPM